MSGQLEFDPILTEAENLSVQHNSLDFSCDSMAAQHEKVARKVPVASAVENRPSLSLEDDLTRMDRSESAFSHDSLKEHGGDEWSSGLWRQVPYRGVFALFGCLTCIVTSIVILFKSNGQPTCFWSISLAVYLALLMATTNMLARFAFSEGAKIAWWHQALRGGAIRDLHKRWAHADKFWSALCSGRDFNLVSLGSIAVTVIAIDGPLIQRASIVTTVSKTSAFNVTAPIAPEIPWGFTSIQQYDNQIMTTPMISAFNDYNTQAPMNSRFSNCDGTCIGHVEAGGLSAKCSTVTSPILYGTRDDRDKTVSPFSVGFNLDNGGTNSSSHIILHVAYTNKSHFLESCTGIRTERTCHLVSATLRYPIQVSGKTLTLRDTYGDAVTQSFQPPSPPLEGTSVALKKSTLGGLYLAASALFSSNATYTFNDWNATYVLLPDTLSHQFLDTSSQNFSDFSDPSVIYLPSTCTSNWTDPTPHILSSLNNMAFRVSLSTANFPFRNTKAPLAPQLLTMEQTNNINVYHSDFRYLVVRTVLTTVLVVFIAFTFHGWWKLGRCVTLNPIETAKAFNAPMLQGPGSNASAQELIKRIGTRELRLGEMETCASGRQLMFAKSDDAAIPRSGVVYQ